MRVCKSLRCNTRLGPYATSADGLCRDCRGPAGARERAATKKRKTAIKPKRFCDCGNEIPHGSRLGKCKICRPKKTISCANPYCEARVYKKDSFCRECFMAAKHDQIKAQHAGFCTTLKGDKS
jgi:hypothetical protein